MGVYNSDTISAISIILAVILFALLYGLLMRRFRSVKLARLRENPILSPIKEHWWESEAVFNPAAFVHDDKVHLFYRALGRDGVSRIGYAWSNDGVTFDRLPYPVFSFNPNEDTGHHRRTSPMRLSYDTINNPSGGGWGGSEDPRVVVMNGHIYMTFNMFNGWESMRVGFTAISEEDFRNKTWRWKSLVYLSHQNDRQKNWVLFPEQIKSKFALLHNLHAGQKSRVRIKYLDSLDIKEPLDEFTSPDPQAMRDRQISWHSRMRSAGPPPLKTDKGWLLLYHAMDSNEPNKYKLGAMLLDLKSPSKVLYRSPIATLEPDMWYENDWKPGIIYASGAVVFGEDLIVYYGGGDKYVAAARINLEDFLNWLINNSNVHS